MGPSPLKVVEAYPTTFVGRVKSARRPLKFRIGSLSRIIRKAVGHCQRPAFNGVMEAIFLGKIPACCIRFWNDT